MCRAAALSEGELRANVSELLALAAEMAIERTSVKCMLLAEESEAESTMQAMLTI